MNRNQERNSISMHPEDLEEAIEDVLINAEARRGGYPGVVMNPDLVYGTMQERGLLGKKCCLTVRGAAEARRAQIAYFGEVQ